MLKFLAGLAFCVSVFPPLSMAEAPHQCEEAALSRKVERQASSWEEKARWYGKADLVSDEIDAALTTNQYGPCEVARVKRAQLNVHVWSDQWERSIPALEELIASTNQAANPDWFEDIDRLSMLYRQSGDYDKLARFSLDHLNDSEGHDTLVLERSLLLSRIGQGKDEEAFAQLVRRVNSAPETITRWDMRFAYALANRIGRVEDASLLKTVAEEKLGGLLMPDRLPQIDGDDLTHLLARETDIRYILEITRLPRPSYPPRAAQRGLEAVCDVYFDVSIEGKPINVEPECTSELFVKGARSAVRGMRLTPLMIDGVAYEMSDYVYPLEYRLSPD